MTGINVLVIVGIRTTSISRALTQSVAKSSSDGISVTVFDGLVDLPPYSETLEARRAPDSVVALRTAATEAHAVLVVTNYRAHIPAIVHNAIDWLTRQWNHSALHDKPLAVMGPAAGRYSGVWSHHQTEASRRTAGPRIVEPITVGTLQEAIRKLAGEVGAGDETSWATPTSKYAR